MSQTIFINQHSVHLWRIAISELVDQERELTTLLNHDEMERAHRFKFDIHRQRFIITRACLRKVLSQYIGIPPQEIIFSYGEKGKPFLESNTQQIQFNVSHSEDMAVVAITPNFQIGVDIEKNRT